MKDYYRILGLPFGAPVEQVRVRYWELARRYHPDVSSEPDAEEKMRLINEAYQVLSTPELRLRYHLLILARQQRRARARQKALHRIWLAYQTQNAVPSLSTPIPTPLRYLLIGLLIGVAGAAVVYHLYHPFVVNKANLGGYGWVRWPPFLELPATITELYLQENRFSEVPAVVWKLPHLQVLRLDRNELHSLSSRITTLRELEVISLRENALTVLPWGWGDLQRVREIDLRNNRLTHIPLEILELPRLTRLDLRGNPLSPEMRQILAERRHPGVLWDEVTAERDHTPKFPRDGNAEAASRPASFPAGPHAAE